MRSPRGSIGASQATIRGDIATSRTLTSDTTYVLSGFVKVRSGATLTIQAGTRLVGDSTVAGSLLMITRGARIDARGTATLPIVFTSQRPAGNRAPGDWGGLVLVGNAPSSRAVASARTIGVVGSTTQAPETYGGGTSAGDDSGVLRYVRVEFAGAAVPAGTDQSATQVASFSSTPSGGARRSSSSRRSRDWAAASSGPGAPSTAATSSRTTRATTTSAGARATRAATSS